jgi:hypothetical protein
MSIVIERKKGFQILRLTSEDLSEPEAGRTIDGIRFALSEGIRCQAISLETPLRSNVMMMGLLVICEKMVRRFGGHLGLILKSEFNETGLRALCDSLNISVYENENEFMEGPAVVAAMHKVSALLLHSNPVYVPDQCATNAFEIT